MAGFFNKAEAITLIGNINTELIKKAIPTGFSKFNETCDSLTDSYSSFNQTALNRKFYTGKSNVYSAPIREILDRMASSENTFSSSHIIFTDGVVSVKKFHQEIAVLKSILAEFTKQQDVNISIYAYRMPFSGTYYSQPSNKEVKSLNVERNFYAIVFSKLKHLTFLNNLLGQEKQIVTYQHFNGHYNGAVQLLPQYKNTPVVNNNINLTLNSNATYDNILNLNLVITDTLGREIEKSDVITDEETMTLSFHKKTRIPNRFFIKSKKNNYLFPSWDSLDYAIESEPTSAKTIDHSKTFRLKLLLEAFQYVMKDSPLLESEVQIDRSTELGVESIYTLFLDEQPQKVWYKLYFLLLILAILSSAIITVGFYFINTDNWQWFNYSHYKSWGVFLITTSLSVLATSFLVIILTDCKDCFEEISITTAIKHSILNAIYTAIFFIIISLFLKGKSNNYDKQSVPL